MTRSGTLALLAVFVGGTLGTGARAWLGATLDSTWPLGTFTANVAGAFALGLLLEGLILASADGVPHQGWRLFLGTGLLGGFTTYSSLAVGADALAGRSVTLGLLYAVGSLGAGLVACALGIAVAGWLGSVHDEPVPEPEEMA